MPVAGPIFDKELLYIFDFGDEWHFGIKLARSSDTLEPGVRYADPNRRSHRIVGIGFARLGRLR